MGDSGDANSDFRATSLAMASHYLRQPATGGRRRSGRVSRLVEEGKPTRAFERPQHISRKAFEGSGKFFPGKDASLDHNERLRLHETVRVRHADYGHFEHALMRDAAHRTLRLLREIE
jgi:hypothetical protein